MKEKDLLNYIKNHQVLDKSTLDYIDVNGLFGEYVYKDPSEYNNDWLKNSKEIIDKMNIKELEELKEKVNKQLRNKKIDLL